MVLVDTSIWVDFFNGVASAGANELDGLLGSGRILIGDLILAEILRGYVIIGTFCVLNDHELLHSDRDFDPMEQALGLHIYRQTR